MKHAGLATAFISGAKAIAPTAGAATSYAARHAISGTMPGQIGLELSGRKLPLSRRLANAKEQLDNGRNMSEAARHGEGLTDPNKVAHLAPVGEMMDDNKRQEIESGLLYSWSDDGHTKQALTGLELAAPFVLAPIVGAAASGVKGLYDSHRANNSWEHVIKENPSLNTKKHREAFSVIKDFSPDIAANPVTLRSELRRMGQYDDVPHEFVGGLASAQDTIGRRSLFNTGLTASVQGLPKIDVGKLDGSSDGKRRAELGARADAAHNRSEADRQNAEIMAEIDRRRRMSGGMPNFSVGDLPRMKKNSSAVASFVPGTSAWRMRRAVNADAKEPVQAIPLVRDAAGNIADKASGMGRAGKIMLGIGAAGALGLGAHALYKRRKAQEAEAQGKEASLAPLGKLAAPAAPPKYRPIDPSDEDDSLITRFGRTNPVGWLGGGAGLAAGAVLGGPIGAALGAPAGYLIANRLSPDSIKDRNRQMDASLAHQVATTGLGVGGMGLGAIAGGPVGMLAGGVGGIMLGDHLGRNVAQSIVEEDARRGKTKRASSELAEDLSVFDV